MYYGYNQPCVPVMPVAVGGNCGSDFGGCICAVVIIFFIIMVICGCGCGFGFGGRFDGRHDCCC